MRSFIHLTVVSGSVISDNNYDCIIVLFNIHSEYRILDRSKGMLEGICHNFVHQNPEWSNYVDINLRQIISYL